MNGDLVNCTNCGSVFNKAQAAGFVRCPVCENSSRKTQPVPKHGRCHVWWDAV